MQSDRGIELSRFDGPLITRSWDNFSAVAGPSKAGHGRWGLFMEPDALVAGIPDAEAKSFEAAKYKPDGTRSSLLTVSGDSSDPAGVILDVAGPLQFRVNGSTERQGRVLLPGEASLDFGMQTRQMLNLHSDAFGIGIQNSTLNQRAGENAGFPWFAGGRHGPFQDDPGGGVREMAKHDIITGQDGCPLSGT